MTYPQLSDLEITHPQVQDAVDAAREWQERKRAGDEGASLLLAGPNGSGKSHIARAIQWSHRIRHDDTDLVLPDGSFYKAADLMLQMSPSVSDNGMIAPAPISSFLGIVPVIVLDDIGAKVSMPFIKGGMQEEEMEIRYFLLLEACAQRHKEVWGDRGESKIIPFPPSLIMTTNLDIGGHDDSEFADHIGPRAWSRLQKICPKGFMVDMRKVPDYRKRLGGR